MDRLELAEFKRATELRWSSTTPDERIFGMQFQQATHWNEGLGAEEINSYELALGTAFPYDFRLLLATMNGTTPMSIDLAGCTTDPRLAPGVYVYPRDVELVQRQVSLAETDRALWTAELLDQGFEVTLSDRLVAFYGHRYIVCSPDLTKCAVLSIYHDTAIVYGSDLAEYLRAEFL